MPLGDVLAPPGSRPEEDLLRAIGVERDVRAFAAWLRGAEPELRAALRSFAAHVDVEAVVQETLLRVWQVAPRVVIDGRGESLLRLALRIGRNLAIDEARRLKAAPLPERTADLRGESAEPSDPLLRDRLVRCRDELPRQPRRALDAALDAQGSRREADVAAGLGMRTNTYLQNLARARRLLLVCLERLGVARAEVLE